MHDITKDHALVIPSKKFTTKYPSIAGIALGGPARAGFQIVHPQLK